jgi:predicted TIM-barrel fold metal-dependent hydrolase
VYVTFVGTVLPRPALAAAPESQLQKPRIEVCFVLDTTGSMSGLIEGAKQKIWSIANELTRAKPTPEIRMGLIGYRDRGDAYIVKTFDLTNDIDRIYGQLQTFQAAGGGDTPESVNEALQEAVTKFGAKGVTLGGHVNGEDLSLPKFDPFWAKAAEMNELVFMHPGGSENIVRDNAFRGRGALGNIMGNPLETTYFLSRLIFDGVFDRHPRLKVCGAHAGGYLPSYFGRTEVACDVRGNANCANKKRPKEYLRSQILIDTMIFSEEGFRHLVAEMGVGQIVYGTDNPFNWPVNVDLVLNAPFLNNTEKEAILSGNLMKLLKIST